MRARDNRGMFLRFHYPSHLNYAYVIYDWGGDKWEDFCHRQYNNSPNRSSSILRFLWRHNLHSKPIKTILAAHVVIPIPL